MDLIVALHIFACFFMTGVIWLVQVLVYPNFGRIPKPHFAEYHAYHTRQITWVVGPAMTLELFTAFWIWYADLLPVTWYFDFDLINLGSIAALWVHTVFIAIPLHNRLPADPAQLSVHILRANAARTLIWTLRSLAWIWILTRPLA